MADDLKRLHQWADGLLHNLTPAARRQLARDIARRLGDSQKKRIAAQQNPDGSAYAPRLRQKVGKLRRGKMFAKLCTTKFLRTTVTDSAAVVGFAGRVERIARVHQYGLRDRVRPGGPEVQYTRREVLGYTEQDEQMVGDVVIAHLAR